MSEKEIGKPKRKKKVSETEETPAVKKIAIRKRVVKEKVELKDSASEPTIKTTSAKRTRSAKKAPVELNEKIEPAESTALETPAVAVNLTEPAQATEDVKTDLPAEIKPRKKVVRAKKTPTVASSDSLVKKIVSRTKKQKSESPEAETPTLKAETRGAKAEKQLLAEVEAAPTAKKEESPIFKQLAEPELPSLPQENRARLQMQSPNKIFLYWTVKHNPFETLQRALPARAQNYQLTAKLLDLTNNTEELFQVGNPSGSWWFNVNSNTAYKAELGFTAPGRPFVRLMYSNTVQTPRSEPSSNTDWSTDFKVSATQFAEVLEASGYSQDAFEVAVTGDNRQNSDDATRTTFLQLTGSESSESVDDLRLALFALASGATLESLRNLIGAGLFAMLEEIVRVNAEKLSAQNVMSALKDNFEFENETEEFLTPVFGASSINFPKRFRSPKFSPISSLR
jgi:hypothetical protein